MNSHFVELGIVDRPGLAVVEPEDIENALRTARSAELTFVAEQRERIAKVIPLLHREEERLYVSTIALRGPEDALAARVGFCVGVRVVGNLLHRNAIDLTTVQDNVRAHADSPRRHKSFIEGVTKGMGDVFGADIAERLDTVKNPSSQANVGLALLVCLTFRP